LKMAAAQLSVPEQQISQFLADLLNLEAIEVGFNCFLTHRPDLNKANEENAREEFIKILKTVQTESPSGVETAVKYYVSQAASLSNPKKLEQLFGFLYDAVGRHVVPARLVCESLLNCEKLVYTNCEHWVQSFALVRKIVGGVDYKGVREIMKNCIEKAAMLPVGLNSGVTQQCESLKKVLSYIFDRNAALLPGYFIVNEILKSYPENKTWPHWSLVGLVSNFLNSFRPAASMVSCTNKWRLVPVVEQLGRAHVMSTWKLDPVSLKFFLKGAMTYERILPYCRDLTCPQPQLIRYLLSQPYSKDLVNHVLGLQKPRKDSTTASGRCAPLEQQMVLLLVEAMQISQDNPSSDILPDLFRNIASDLIFFVLFQFVSFPHVITDLADQLEKRNLTAGRDKLMWVLLQFISGSIQKNPTADFIPVLKLYNMYSESEPLPVPDTSLPTCVEQLAATGIFIHLKRKAGGENLRFSFSLPPALTLHHEFLVTTAKGPCSLNLPTITYTVPLLCNTFSTTQDLFQLPMSALVEAVGGSTSPSPGHTPMPGTNCVSATPIQPLPMDILDSLSVHSKMSLIHSIVTHILKQVQTKSTVALSPSIVETYSRLLVYSEIESLGIKGFLNQLLPKVFAQQSWGTLHTLLEIFSYRLHHIQAHYRLSLLTHLHQLAAHNILNNHAQLHLTVESSALRLITGFGSAEIAPPKNQPPGGVQKTASTLYGDSEELNRVVILTLARAVHIGGLEQNGSAWLKEVVSSIMHNTPHAWPSHTLQNFPPVLVDMISETNAPKENVAQLKKSVEEEWRSWGTVNNENDIIQHFSLPQGNNNLFLCLLWKMILETDDISPIAYKVLERIGAKQLTAHLRSFCDFLVHEFSKSGGGGHVNKCIDAMNNMIWKYNIITLDRLVLCMALRHHEGNEAQVCFFIIQLLLLKPPEFRNRVNEFCRTMSPEHHLLDDWHQKHLEIHDKFPEKFAPDVLTEKNHNFQTLPMYFGNVCLRFIPVFDIVVHRFLELPPVQKSLETLFDHLGCLYKFHDRPMTYLYNTLHYYEARLRDRSPLKKKIVASITDALKEVRPAGWALTQEMTDKYLSIEGPDEPLWRPGTEYFFKLVGRLVAALDPSSNVFPRMDWRFNEFPNEGSHCLYVTCVELMSIPDKPASIGEKLIDVVLQTHSHIPPDKLPEWINAVGLLVSNLPEAFWAGLHNKLESYLDCAPLANWTLGYTPAQVFNFQEVHDLKTDTSLAYMLAIAHATWHHSGFTQICGILDLVRDRLIKLVETEEQMLFIFHLVGPFLQRLHSDRFMRVLFELTVQLYEILLRVDRSVTHMKYMDAVCDLLYHIKYQFTGDSVKADAERIVRQLKNPLQLRLRFIAQVQLKQETEGVVKQEQQK